MTRQFGLSYAIEQRLRFIDFLLSQYGYVNRSALTDYFGISESCVSNDLRAYQEIAPKNTVYDKKAMAYVRAEGFERVWG